MELLNATGMPAAYTMGMEPSGRELLVVVVKSTFRIPKNGEAAELADEQQPLVMADTFTGVVKTDERTDRYHGGEHADNNYRMLDARDGWNYMAVPITAHDGAEA